MPENEPSLSPLLAPLRSACTTQFSQLKSHFQASGDGAAVLRLHSEEIDSLLQQIYPAAISPELAPVQGGEELCLAAVGGYGRAELFPFSDLDLLFVARDERILKAARENIAAFARALWDLQLRVSHSARTLEDCGRLHGGNLEFSVSLLDLRYVAGDRAIYEELRSATVPHMITRDGQDLARNLIDRSLERHAKHGKTIFHLEPDVKESPGGLRDFHAARWLGAIAEIRSGARPAPANDKRPAKEDQPVEDAVQFLSDVRCFLHFERDRNDNLLTYELHESAARLGLGVRYGERMDAAEWMREYYRRVRSIERLSARATEDARPSRSSLYGLFLDWRSRLSNADFAVIHGKIFPRARGPADWPLLLRMFEMMARHLLDLSREAERWMEESVAALSGGSAGGEWTSADSAALWPALRDVLTLPGAADALRAMRQLGMLAALIPEFRAVDSLVVRDFYHRYTVDEHTFRAIQTLSDLKRAAQQGGGDAEGLNPWRRKFGEIYAELERPGVLALALLLHDVGKGMAAESHVEGSVQAAQSVCARLGLDPPDSESVIFLIGSHLEMSSTVARRDIFDPETLRAFAQKTGAPERLKMLCLMTYADVNAVNPEAMTPWKAEMLWQLYAMTENYFTRSVDQERLAPSSEAAIHAIPAAGGESGLDAFLNGFPRRYLAAHSPSEVGEHFAWAQRIAQNPVTVKVRRREAYSELTALAVDRPLLFASISGALAAWGMNILKAEAYANRAGIVLDVFRFHDLHRTLELNPSEITRLEESVAQVLSGNTNVATLMQGRMNPRGAPRSKIKIPAQLGFDDGSSSRCTILELVAEDRPGLLYQVSATLAELGCNIEVALVETEAQKALDVFYLTANSAKLLPELQQAIRRALLQKLARP